MDAPAPRCHASMAPAVVSLMSAPAAWGALAAPPEAFGPGCAPKAASGHD